MCNPPLSPPLHLIHRRRRKPPPLRWISPRRRRPPAPSVSSLHNRLFSRFGHAWRAPLLPWAVGSLGSRRRPSATTRHWEITAAPPPSSPPRQPADTMSFIASLVARWTDRTSAMLSPTMSSVWQPLVSRIGRATAQRQSVLTARLGRTTHPWAWAGQPAVFPARLG
jgi:hypothetical protein